MKLALFKSTKVSSAVWARQLHPGMDPDVGDESVRVSEWVEADFPALSETEVRCHLEAYRHRELQRNRERREALLAEVLQS